MPFHSITLLPSFHLLKILHSQFRYILESLERWKNGNVLTRRDIIVIRTITTCAFGDWAGAAGDSRHKQLQKAANAEKGRTKILSCASVDSEWTIEVFERIHKESQNIHDLLEKCHNDKRCGAGWKGYIVVYLPWLADYPLIEHFANFMPFLDGSQHCRTHALNDKGSVYHALAKIRLRMTFLKSPSIDSNEFRTILTNFFYNVMTNSSHAGYTSCLAWSLPWKIVLKIPGEEDIEIGRLPRVFNDE